MYNFGFINGLNDQELPYSNNVDGVSYSFEFLFRNKTVNYKIETPGFFIEQDEPFIYILDFKHGRSFSESYIPEEVLEYVKAKKCKICIMLFSEPFSTEYRQDINNLATQYGLDRESLVFSTGDLMAKNLEQDLFEFLPFNYFLSTPWFTHKIEHTPFEIQPSKLRIKFLSLNRVPRRQRYIFLYELLHRPHLFFSTLLSFGDKANEEVLDRKKKQMYNAIHVDELLKNSIKSKQIEIFFKDRVFGIDIDTQDKSVNLAQEFDLSFYQKTFCSVVSESSVEQGKLFFSEKTSKPLFAKQPFIMVGNPYSLQKLHELGFKTFNEFWDESYDLEKSFERRLEKILNVMEEINKKSLIELQQMLLDMEGILEHNHRVFLGLDYTLDFLEKIKIK